MFTLPVESWKIVLAKALAAVLMIHISLIVGIFSIGILAGELTFLKAVPGSWRNALSSSGPALKRMPG